MNRTQKKCLIASTGLHLLLGLTLIFGPGFLSSRDKADDLQVLDFVPAMAIDGNATGGGGPRMRPPSPTPPAAQSPPQQAQPPPPVAPAPQPKPQPVRTEQPEPPKIEKISPEAIAPLKEKKPKIVVNTDEVVRNANEIAEARAAAAKRERDAARAEQRRLAMALGRATRDLNSSFSSGTDIKFNDGFGGSGPAYANWLQIVKSIYFNDWSGRVPDGATDDSAVATASVIIARDGTVISSHITQTSGSPEVDKSIEATLDHVRFTTPFPESSKEDQRELEITFSVKAVKQLLG